jgi:hypothetical protein
VLEELVGYVASIARIRRRWLCVITNAGGSEGSPSGRRSRRSNIGSDRRISVWSRRHRLAQPIYVLDLVGAYRLHLLKQDRAARRGVVFKPRNGRIAEPHGFLKPLDDAFRHRYRICSTRRGGLQRAPKR